MKAKTQPRGMGDLGSAKEGLTTTGRSVADDLAVLVERTLTDLERRGGPVCASSGELLVRDVHAERVVDGVDGDDVAVLNEGDGSSNLSLGDDVTDDESVRSDGIPSGRIESQWRWSKGRKARQRRTTHPPENRPSVKQATSYPSPAPMIKLVGLSISGIPGPPLGPRYRRTTTVFSPALIEPDSTALTNSSSRSNARALPVK